MKELSDLDLSQLNIDINEPLEGFVGNPPLYAEVIDELTPQDLVVAASTNLGSTPSPLKKIRAKHHHAARLLATGMKAIEVGAVVGLCSSRLSILQKDPAFAELVSFYEGQEDASFAAVRDQMVTLGVDAAAELHDRLLDQPESLTAKNLVDIMTTALDRGGHSPVHKTESTNLVIGKDDLEDIKRQVADGLQGTIKDKFKEARRVKDVSSSAEPEVGKALPGPSAMHTESEALEGSSGEGDFL